MIDIEAYVRESMILPHYKGMEVEFTYDPTMFDFTVKATKDGKEVEFVVHKEDVYWGDQHLCNVIAKGLEPLARPDPPLQVDLSIKDEEA